VIPLATGLTLLAALGGGELAPIDNPFLPLEPGSRWVYRETSTDGTVQRVVVRVTHRTKLVASGVRARVVRDTVTERGRVVEDTFDWYAQDRRGNVWYVGEDTKEYENGKLVSTAGSWEAGVDGAKAGIAMLAHPRAGATYKQENRPGEAEDRARVLAREGDTLLTRDWNPLERGAVEYKVYRRGVGQILAIGAFDGSVERLVRFEPGG
jgi:hypothetical protein